MTANYLGLGTQNFSTFDDIKKGDSSVYLKIAQEAGIWQFTPEQTEQLTNGFENFTALAQQQGFESAFSITLDNASSSFYSNLTQGNDIALSRYSLNGAESNLLPEALKFLDVSLLETTVGKGILSELGGGSLALSASGDIAAITGSTAAVVVGKTMARIPIVGLLIAALQEIPDLKDAKKNGDLGAQICRSAIEVASTTIGLAVGSVIGSALGPIGTIVGGFIGSQLGKVGKAIGNLIFGKSIKDKMKDGDAANNIMKNAGNVNFYNIGTGKSIYDEGAANVNVDSLINSINKGMAQYS